MDRSALEGNDPLDRSQLKESSLSQPSPESKTFVVLLRTADARVEEIIRLSGERFTVAAVGIASYDPALDREAHVLAAGTRVMAAVASGAAAD